MQFQLPKNVFTPLADIHLTRFALFIAGIVGGWGILEGVVPEPWHDNLLKIFLFLAAVLGYVLNNGKARNGNGKENINNANVEAKPITGDTITVSVGDIPKPKL